MTNETNNKEYSLEQILRATLYSIGDAVIATDKRGRVTMMNSVAGKSYDEVTLANYHSTIDLERHQ